MVTMQDAISVIEEFVTDVEAVGLDAVHNDWPDIAVTYDRAVQFLIAAGHREKD